MDLFFECAIKNRKRGTMNFSIIKKEEKREKVYKKKVFNVS